MFESAEEFYTSMGFAELPTSFWNQSVFEKVDDEREMSCEPTSYDFRDGREYRYDDVHNFVYSNLQKVLYGRISWCVT